ncbi:DUF493 domain-containing protein [Sphingobacterium phlebotomi]|uniref:DUF493 domain-containing protein n=1 Tax=Sphingobacterium phlebotomi TaxID=2605433 RepID=A0A5D4HEB4_9SPHI|nr:DUF493 domain-containing protein [Sphingobacterium phlebotomi]TYR38129.1 DUF493 domain-containing protein [Sphingobacterium phlebotomi]
MSEFNNDIHIQDLPDGEGKNTTDFYDNFRVKLNSVEQFPSIYTFKFIVKADSNAQEDVKQLFTHDSTKFSEKESSGGKYKSITVETFVNNAEDVIDYYKKVSKIESVMML